MREFSRLHTPGNSLLKHSDSGFGGRSRQVLTLTPYAARWP